MRLHLVGEAEFLSLARGGASPEAIETLIEGQLSRRRLLLLAAAERHPDLHDALALIARVDREAPPAGRSLLRYPFLEPWFRTGEAGPLCALAASAALAGDVPFELRLPVHGPDLHLPGLGTLHGIGPGEVTLAGPIGSGGVKLDAPLTPVVRAGGVELHPPLTPVVRAGGLAVDDADPLRDRFPAPPLPPGSAAPLADVLEHALPLTGPHEAAIRSALRVVVPLRPPGDGSLTSASVRGCFGAIGMSPPPDPGAAAELLVHEFQHEKLGALLDLVELCTPDGPARYHAPWRPDPRPAAALLQGVYAFAAVAKLRRDRSPTLYDQVGYGLEQLLSGGELTGLGERFCTELGDTLTTRST